jgi:hypothetical protein
MNEVRELTAVELEVVSGARGGAEALIDGRTLIERIAAILDWLRGKR